MTCAQEYSFFCHATLQASHLVYPNYSCPRHFVVSKRKNITNFKGKEGFISVRIGPLCYDEKYVMMGEPAEALSGDLHFIAKQQGLKYPLHHLGWSRKELKMYNDFMASVEKPTMRQMEKLSERYKEQSNGTSVLPKLPTM